MRVLIIEDELPARDKLEDLLKSLEPNLTIMSKIGSVSEAVEYLEQGHQPDLAFVDIHLSDDHSFEIFRRVPVTCPVIFTTAFDRYLLESLEFNSIDYLLKPITRERLKMSLEKVKSLERHFVQGNAQKLINFMSGQSPVKERLLARKGMEFVAVPLPDVAYIFSDHKVTFLRTQSGQQFMLDKNLATLEQDLDPARFFRINRKYIATAQSIDRFKPDNGKIRIYLKPEVTEEIHVSKESAPDFRKWIAG